jgi:alkaline phosphatase
MSLSSTVKPFCAASSSSHLLIKFYYRLISDAAASATAYACGLKTKNRRVGIDADGNYCGTLLEAAKKKGMRTAIVSSDVTFASSAAFVSHVADRGDVTDIGTNYQLLIIFNTILVLKIY